MHPPKLVPNIYDGNKAFLRRHNKTTVSWQFLNSFTTEEMAGVAAAKVSFWSSLPRPFFCLAPMANVTDVAFRHIVARSSNPDVIWTEFVSCEAMCASEERRQQMMFHFFRPKCELGAKPLVVQLFGSKPEQFYECAKIAADLGVDGIDINMGCPDVNVLKQNSGAALINHPDVAKEIIRQTKRGAGHLPVSVKTRLGFNRITASEWIPHVLEMEPVALTIHGRTAAEMSLVDAHWDEIGAVADLVRSSGSEALVIGNGDVRGAKQGMELARRWQLDGVMIGRGAIGNPFVFRGVREARERLWGGGGGGSGEVSGEGGAMSHQNSHGGETVVLESGIHHHYQQQQQQHQHQQQQNQHQKHEQQQEVVSSSAEKDPQQPQLQQQQQLSPLTPAPAVPVRDSTWHPLYSPEQVEMDLGCVEVVACSGVELEERLETLLEHTRVFQDLLLSSNHKPFSLLKRMYKHYLSSSPHSKAVRAALHSVQGPAEVPALVEEYRALLQVKADEAQAYKQRQQEHDEQQQQQRQLEDDEQRQQQDTEHHRSSSSSC